MHRLFIKRVLKAMQGGGDSNDRCSFIVFTALAQQSPHHTVHIHIWRVRCIKIKITAQARCVCTALFSANFDWDDYFCIFYLLQICIMHTSITFDAIQNLDKRKYFNLSINHEFMIQINKQRCIKGFLFNCLFLSFGSFNFLIFCCTT